MYRYRSLNKNGFNHYLECALWSSIDDSGAPLDQEFSITDIESESKSKLQREYIEFIEKAEMIAQKQGFNLEWDQAGHDFWLTRNGHGAGFWDRDNYNKETRDQLTELSHAYGEISLYVTDVGELCVWKG